MKMWSSRFWLRFKQSQIKPEKCFRGFIGIRTHGLCVSAAVLHQPLTTAMITSSFHKINSYKPRKSKLSSELDVYETFRMLLPAERDLEADLAIWNVLRTALSCAFLIRFSSAESSTLYRTAFRVDMKNSSAQCEQKRPRIETSRSHRLTVAPKRSERRGLGANWLHHTALYFPAL